MRPLRSPDHAQATQLHTQLDTSVTRAWLATRHQPRSQVAQAA